MQRERLDYSGVNADVVSGELTLNAVRAQTSFINQVYGWMCGGLILTALISYGIASHTPLIDYLISNTIVFFGLIIAELVVVGFFAARLTKMSAATAAISFVLYSVLNGVVLSLICYNFTAQSLATTFFATAGTFGVMSLYGYVTKRDLTSLGNLCFMLLIGVILATVVNIFVDNNMLHWIITYIGIAVFVGLTAYDTQKIKAMSISISGTEDVDNTKKYAVSGAFTLYLDFINLFLLLLRIFGGGRD
jgi:FtsH-binding integral membrane protein